MGEFNARAIIFDPSWALDHLRASLPNGVYLKSSVSAADQLRRRINLTSYRPERGFDEQQSILWRVNHGQFVYDTNALIRPSPT